MRQASTVMSPSTENSRISSCRNLLTLWCVHARVGRSHYVSCSMPQLSSSSRSRLDMVKPLTIGSVINTLD